MIKCIIHTADIHIRNNDRQEEYLYVLKQFVEKCKKITSKYEKDECRIVICGDLTHSKSTVSNELFSFVSGFIRQLEALCQVIVICGNHDKTMNEDRQDTISALFQTADFQNSNYLDMLTNYESGVISDDNVNWCLYSIFDDFKKPHIPEKEEGKFNFGLFHGDLVGSKLYNGMIMSSGVDADIFSGCDYVLASHIHQYQILKHKGINIVFPSSLLQQDFGESVSGHGFVVWAYSEKKGEFTHKFHEISNEYSRYNFEIDSIEDFKNDTERLLNL